MVVSAEGGAGRHNPGLTANLSPRWFNFSATYSSGPVLEFKVGMSRLELAQVLKSRYAKNSVLEGGCGAPVDVKFHLLDIYIESDTGAYALSTRDRLCLMTRSKRQFMTFTIANDSVAKISIAIVHS